jgi:hypothetical protein
MQIDNVVSNFAKKQYTCKIEIRGDIDSMAGQKMFYENRLMILVFILLLLVTACLGGCNSNAGGNPDDNGGNNGGNGENSPVFFDDFEYNGNADSELTRFNWRIRTETGAPGYPGAKWLKDNVTFTTVSGQKVLQLSAAVSGSTVSHAEIYNNQAFEAGTYAARVKFSDTPVEGTDGNYICETFFTISGDDNSLNYSECDFEYLPNGGWNGNDNDKREALFYTSWATTSDNKCDRTDHSFNGWHTLTMTVMNGTVTYYVDGQKQFAHGGKYYPDGPMVIDFNLWFLKENTDLLPSKYQQQVDWVYYCKGKTLTTVQVESDVADLRSRSIKRLDQIP